MKLARLIALGAILALSLALLAGCGGNGDGDEGASGAAPFDQTFIDAMVPHHQEAIFMATAAKAAGLSQPDLVEIADAIIDTQQKEIDQMLEWRASWYGSGEVSPSGFEGLGMSMDEMGMQHDPGDLENATDVDATFAAMMVDHHNGAIAMARLALEQGEHAEIRELADAIIGAQTGEVDVLMPHAEGHHEM
jgi:uncharacterized protein (DUF305 family)